MELDWIVDRYTQERAPLTDTRLDITPVPKGRPRRGANGNMYTPEGTRTYEQQVAMLTRPLLPEPTHSELWVVLQFTGVKPGQDLDNLAKSFLDGCNKTIWADDRQISALHIHKSCDGDPGVRFACGILNETATPKVRPKPATGRRSRKAPPGYVICTSCQKVLVREGSGLCRGCVR